jgi:excisionase family DNA binding protein
MTVEGIGPWLSPAEFAEAVGLTHSRVCQKLRAGEIRGHKLGMRPWVIPESEIQRELSRQAESKGRAGRPRKSTSCS